MERLKTLAKRLLPLLPLAVFAFIMAVDSARKRKEAFDLAPQSPYVRWSDLDDYRDDIFKIRRQVMDMQQRSKWILFAGIVYALVSAFCIFYLLVTA